MEFACMPAAALPTFTITFSEDGSRGSSITTSGTGFSY